MAPYAGLIIVSIILTLLFTILFFVNAGFWNSVRNAPTIGTAVINGVPPPAAAVSSADAGLLFALNLIWGLIALIFLCYLIYVLIRDWGVLFGNNMNNNSKRVYVKKSTPDVVGALHKSTPTTGTCARPSPCARPTGSACAVGSVCPSVHRTLLTGL